MHVLNEGRFASRYFPGAGAWMAPFLAMGHPHWGHWVRGRAGERVDLPCRARTRWGVGRYARRIPDGVFSWARALQQPTAGPPPDIAGLVAVPVGLHALMRTAFRLDGLIAGLGLAFAMLCRPMTAAGFALPFGFWLVARVLLSVRSQTQESGDREQLAEHIPPDAGLRSWALATAAVGFPLLVGIVSMLPYNAAITGSMWTTPLSGLHGHLHAAACLWLQQRRSRGAEARTEGDHELRRVGRESHARTRG